MKYLIIAFIVFTSSVNAQTALEIIQKSDENLRGKSSFIEMSVEIIRPKWTKEMKMKSWSKGSERAISVVTSPAKEKGTVFLMRD